MLRSQTESGKNTRRPSTHLHRTNSQRPVDVQHKNTWTVSNKSLFCQMSSEGIIWETRCIPNTNSLSCAQVMEKMASWPSAARFWQANLLFKGLWCWWFFSYSTSIPGGLWDLACCFLRNFENMSKKTENRSMKQKDNRLRLRSDTFLILLFMNTYVLIPDIYHSPNIAVAQKYGFESFFCWSIFPCAFKGFEVLLTCLCDPQWKCSLSSILGLHHLSHFWPLFASK